MTKVVPIAGLLLAELVRRYSILQIECALLELHEISWFLQKAIDRHGLRDELDLKFEANYYGPYANNLMHLLNGLDGSYLKSDKRIPDCNPLDVIWFNDQEKERVDLYLRTEAKDYLPALEETAALIDGFESPYGMELLATVDWLLVKENCQPTLRSIKEGLAKWPAGKKWADRKLSIFDDRSLQFAINRLSVRSAV